MTNIMSFGIGLLVLSLVLGVGAWFILKKKSILRYALGGLTGAGAVFIALVSALLIYSGRVPENVIGTSESPKLISVHSGEEVKLDDFLGKTIVVNYWATWCAPCIEEFPTFEKAVQNYNNSKVVGILIVSSEAQDVLDGFHKQHKLSLPSYRVDPESALFSGIHSRPVTLIFNKSGDLIRSHFGSLDYEKLISLIRLGMQ